MILGACSDGSFISFKGYSGVLLVPGFLVADLDIAMRYICAEQVGNTRCPLAIYSQVWNHFLFHIIVRAHIHRERTVFSPLAVGDSKPLVLPTVLKITFAPLSTTEASRLFTSAYIEGFPTLFTIVTS